MIKSLNKTLNGIFIFCFISCDNRNDVQITIPPDPPPIQESFKITDFESLKLEIDEIINLIELAREETDQDILVEGQNKLKEYESLIKKKELELKSLMNY